MSRRGGDGGPDGLVVVDKAAGWTSHDVVARMRRIAGTRKVGHAGTLDPMATGVLVLGMGRATRLLGHLAAGEKEYAATARLGRTTDTDDADGSLVAAADAAHLDEAAVRAALPALTGELDQVPPDYSAVKVAGRRSYARARAGEEVALAARRVTVSVLDLQAVRAGSDGDGGYLDVDLHVVCSAGTYVRALARDLGAALGVGGHLTALRRTRAGSFTLAGAHPLADLERDLHLQPLAEAVAAAFPRRDVDADTARRVGHGGRLDAAGIDGPYGVFAPDGTVLALMAEQDGVARSLVVFAPA